MTRADDLRAAADDIDTSSGRCRCAECTAATLRAARLREYAYTIEMVENNLRYWGESKRMKGLVEMADALKGDAT